MMNRKHFLLPLLTIFTLCFARQAQAQNPVLMEINGEKITKKEFIEQYNKNNIEKKTPSKQELEEYLQLYINYKLKLADARAKHFDSLPGYRRELQTYRDQLAEPYLNDAEVTKNILDTAYMRLKEWVRASHILFRTDANAMPNDTLVAYNNAMSVYEKLMAGASFEKMAEEFSEDPSAKDREIPKEQGGGFYAGNKGDLGYFSGFEMLFPFETACFNMKKGDISKPVRSSVGYHIIKLTDRLPAPFYQADIAHIWISAYKHDSTQCKALIEEAMKRLEKGDEFADVADKYSDDPKNKKGLLSKTKVSGFPPSYGDELVKLKTNETSKPFHSSLGWHIIRPMVYYPLPSFDEMESELTRMVSRDNRSFRSRVSFVEKSRKEYGYREFPENLTEIISLLHDTIFTHHWQRPKDYSFSKPLAIMGTDTVWQYQFINYFELVQQRHLPKPIEPIAPYIQDLFDKWNVEQSVNYAKKHLEEKYPKFKSAMADYGEGILIFNISNDHVWEKSVKDTAGLQRFYEQHKHKYLWEQRADATLWTIDNSVIDPQQAYKIISKGYKKKWTDNKIRTKILEKINKSIVNPEQYVRFQWGKFEKGDNPLIDQAANRIGVNLLGSNGEQTSIVTLYQMLPQEVKTLDECRGRAISEYQQALEREWIAYLRDAYRVIVHEEVFQSLF